MVEIIKKGKLPSERVRRTTCRTCNTEFTFKEGEARYSSDQREGGYFAIACPLCRNVCCVGE